jgi:hypothetical protein
MTVEAFEAALIASPAPLGTWCSEMSLTEWSAFADAAEYAAEMLVETLPKGCDVTVCFRDDLTVRYVGDCDGPQGATFHGFLFNVPDRVEAITWVEDDGAHISARWRGDRAVFQEVALQLRLFAGAWLKRGRVDDAQGEAGAR